MKLTINNKEYEVTEKQVKAIEEMVNPEVSALYWEPKLGDDYWIITDNADEYRDEKLCLSKWQNDWIDKCRLSIGNVYKDKVSAQKHLNYLKALTRVKKYIVEHDLGKEWVDGENNVWICYDCEDGELCWRFRSYLKYYSPFGYLKYDKQLLDKFIEDNKQDLLVILGVE